jgi:hypothetical protein
MVAIRSATIPAQAGYCTIEYGRRRDRCPPFGGRVGTGLKRIVIPAKAGIQAVFPLIATSEPDDAFGIKWIPAFAGMTGGICGDDGWGLREHRNRWRRAPANRAIPGTLRGRNWVRS